MDVLQRIADAVVDMDEDLVRILVEEAINEKKEYTDIIDLGLTKGMEEVGLLFEQEEYFIPELLACADAMYAGLDLLSPFLSAQKQKPKKGKIVIGAVEGDTHDIGKSIVALLLQVSGYEVIDLGRDVSARRFVDTAIEQQAQIIAISSLMTTTMGNMAHVIRLLCQEGVRDRFQVILGGKPISPAFAKRIGADGYAANAAGAVRLVDRILGADDLPIKEKGADDIVRSEARDETV